MRPNSSVRPSLQPPLLSSSSRSSLSHCLPSRQSPFFRPFSCLLPLTCQELGIDPDTDEPLPVDDEDDGDEEFDEEKELERQAAAVLAHLFSFVSLFISLTRSGSRDSLGNW